MSKKRSEYGALACRRGPPDSNGYSQVIYAGTNGDGPVNSATPQGGRVWVSTSAGAGLASWADRTASINPQGFPISAIALDTADPAGLTAYVAIMGFHTPHVWKTGNAGLSWSDFTANLPDAPLNSIIVDPGASLGSGTVYAGTDVGAFASSTGSPSWSDVGPASGQTGFLPNVAVTSLAIFNFSGLKSLRAATYGRGIWKWDLITTPDFQLAVSNNPLTVFAGHSAGYNGTMSALNGYSSSVNLSCTPAGTNPPRNCSATPPSVTPGMTFSLAASDGAGDYVFNLHAVGTDSAAVTHDFPLTLHVIDFSLGAPSSSSVSIVPGKVSTPVSLLVSASGAFAGSVTLSCAGLPQGASCQSQPAAVVDPTSGSPIDVFLTVRTAGNTPLGASQVTINASTTGAASKTQTLMVNVSSAPDYALAIANPSLTAQVNSTAVFNGALTALNGYSSQVTLTCGAGAPPNCVVSPAAVSPVASGAAFTVAVSSSVSQAFNLKIQGVGGDPVAIAHSSSVSFSALPLQSFDFTMGLMPTSSSVAVGQSTSFSLTVAPTSGTFPNPVCFSCSNLPPLTACNFNPTQVAVGTGNSTVALTISTTAATHAAFAAFSVSAFPFAALLWCAGPKFSLRRRRLCQVIPALFLVIACVSCGGGLQGNAVGGNVNPGTQPGAYNVKVTANAVSVAHSAQLALTVTP